MFWRIGWTTEIFGNLGIILIMQADTVASRPIELDGRKVKGIRRKILPFAL